MEDTEKFSRRSPRRIHLKALRPYEDRLLAALAFFRANRQQATQAHHCLSMYLRQSEPRIMSEVGFYAQNCGKTPEEFLELIYKNPDKAQETIGERFHPEKDTESED